MSQASAEIAQLAEILTYLQPEERAELDQILFDELPIWVPQPGPQTNAYECEADILYFGGSAGGGKSDLLLGLCLTSHTRSIIYRREGVQNLALIDRLLNEILKTRQGWNGQDHVWRRYGRQVEFGSCKDLGDEQHYQGRPHDLKGFDEITHFLEYQFRFLCGWLRSSDIKQRKRIVCTGNPPTTDEGQWVTTYWGPWLDPQHPFPAEPGELRWYTTVDGKDQELPDGSVFVYKGQKLQPLSRTFIPSRVDDNVFMTESGYAAMLQALPEPLRSQMLLGDFTAGSEDNIWQIIPTAWIDAAMARWTSDGRKGAMDSVGADVARGGRAQTIVATRHGSWFNQLNAYPGKQTPDGGTSAGIIIGIARDGAPIHVDVIGVGGSVVDHLAGNEVHVVAVNGAGKADEDPSGNPVTDKSGKLKFRNYRAQIYWQFRESLDPKSGDNIALPPDPELKADLCAPRWKLTTSGILVEAKEEIVARIGRSPDKGDAVVYCSIKTPKRTKSLAGFQPRRGKR